jgi:hypothetical protein
MKIGIVDPNSHHNRGQQALPGRQKYRAYLPFNELSLEKKDKEGQL